MKPFIAYYSRPGENYFGGSIQSIAKGNTKVLAEKIAAITNGDLFEIQQVNPYSDKYDQCTAQAKRDNLRNARPALVSRPENLDSYDEIYLGYPNYWGTMPMAVYTFLEAYDWNGKTIHPFCTHEGSGLSSTPSDIARTAPGAKVDSALAVSGSRAASSDKKLKSWIG